MNLKQLLSHMLFWSALSQCQLSFCAEFLLLTPFGSQSHKNLFFSMAETLAARGHNVTLLSIHPPRKSAFDGIHDLTYPELMPYLDRQREVMTLSGKYGFTHELLGQYVKIMLQMCDVIFENGPFRKWSQEKRMFDVVVEDAVCHDCLQPVGYHFSNATVLYNTANLFPWVAEAINAPIPYSYIPNGLLPLSPTMTFWQRLENSFSLEAYKVGSASYLSTINNKVRQYFPGAISVMESLESVTLVFTNADPVMNVARPNVPIVIDIGGIQCRPPKMLPQELHDIIDNVGNEGFIIFSLGTIFDESQFLPQKRNILMRVFSRLNQTVIWKYGKHDEVIPKNVKIFKSIPQQDLLGHPKIKAFITHSGLLSLQEAIYHGVPMIGIPLFVDQPGNVAFATSLGIMAPLKWDELNEEDVYNAIVTVLNNKSMHEAVRKYSKMFRDQLDSPKDKVSYWMEYLLRHPETNHLRLYEARHLTLFQYFQVDILATIILLALSPICFIGISVKIIRRFYIPLKKK